MTRKTTNCPGCGQFRGATHRCTPAGVPTGGASRPASAGGIGLRIENAATNDVGALYERFQATLEVVEPEYVFDPHDPQYHHGEYITDDPDDWNNGIQFVYTVEPDPCDPGRRVYIVTAIDADGEELASVCRDDVVAEDICNSWGELDPHESETFAALTGELGRLIHPDDDENTTTAQRGESADTFREPRYNVPVRLTGRDGNVFAVIGRVTEAIRRHVGEAEAEAFSAEAFACESYDAVLVLCMRTVRVN